MTTRTRQFTAELLVDDDTSGCAIVLPFDPREVFGKVRAPVEVTIRKHTFRTTVASMGSCYLIPVNKANRARAGAEPGEKFRVRIAADDAPRVVEAPPELERELRRSKRLRSSWEKLSYTRRKELARSIAEAKREDTRVRRLAAALETLRGA